MIGLDERLSRKPLLGVVKVLLCLCAFGIVPVVPGQTNEVTRSISKLRSMDPYVQRDAAWKLGHAKDTRAVEPLITILKNEAVVARQAAVRALGMIADPRAVDALITALNDTDLGVRKSAAEALGKIKDPRAVEPLSEGLKDRDTEIRESAVSALGEIGDAGIEPLVAA
jgi:HEAT repeat protein